MENLKNMKNEACGCAPTTNNNDKCCGMTCTCAPCNCNPCCCA